MNLTVPKRCAVYCRVSSDERLDQSFNSLDAQKDAGLAYVASQRTEGWIPVPDEYIDPGFSGHVTLELSNMATLPVKLWPGMKIGQFCFFRLSSPAEHPYGSAQYGSRYQGQRGPTASRSFESFSRTPPV